MKFALQMIAGWADVDFNSHMCNSAYLDKCTDLRLSYFENQGISMDTFYDLGIGPVVRKDELEYFSEIRLLEKFTISLMLAGLADNASRFLLCSEIHRADGKRSARILSLGGWLDLSARKLVVPPVQIRVALENLDRTSDFQTLPPSAHANVSGA